MRMGFVWRFSHFVFRSYDLEFTVYHLGFRDKGWGSGIRIQNGRIRVWGLGYVAEGGWVAHVAETALVGCAEVG